MEPEPEPYSSKVGTGTITFQKSGAEPEPNETITFQKSEPEPKKIVTVPQH